MPRLPEGTITFMLTDLQGSTQAWEKQPKAMRSAMSRHDEILASTVQHHGGALVEAGREGDSVLAVFRTAAAGAACALDIQKNFATESWPQLGDLRLRVALHTGEAQLREGHYFGAALNRCARLLAICHPGQILLTKASEAMLVDELPPDADLQDLGLHRLKDLVRPEQVFQLNDLNRPTEFPPVQSLLQRQTNMPTSLTTFVGRASELSALKSLLARSRMVTLTGPGGSGKTRLAAEVGRVCFDLWPGGVWWVELAPVNDPRQVPGVVVAALELPGRERSLDVVTAWLAARRAVLVLDNCEHLVAACAELCQAVLQRCPELTIIATSREALGVAGETRWPVSSMAIQDAVQLFEARAGLVVPDFKVTATRRETVTQICQKLDGIPLAIELAAARAGMLTEHEILTQLSDRFGLLTGGSRTAPERQQTMIATIEWSYRLLTQGEAMLFRRLSVFRGGFTLESARAVCANGLGSSVLDLLFGLVQKSMVVAERPEGSGTRYGLLESQLAYAADRLRESAEAEPIRRLHHEYFLERLDTALGRPRLSVLHPAVADPAWIAREWANLLAAAGWARSYVDDLGLLFAVRLAESGFPDLTARRNLLADTLEHSGETGLLRAKALMWAAILAAFQGDSDAALSAAAACLVLARDIGDVEVLGRALLVAGQAYSSNQDLETEAAMYEEAIALLKAFENRPLLAAIRNNLALLAVVKGDYAAACDILIECVAAGRTEGDGEATADYLDSLASAQLGLGDSRSATASWNEALSTNARSLNYRGIIYCLQGLSRVAGSTSDDNRAVRLAAAAKRLSDEWLYRSDPWTISQVDETLRRSRSRLGTRKSDVAWNQGRAMTVDQAINYALGEGEPEAMIDAGPLTRREREVARLVASGLTNREIAEQLFIAERSAEGHVERIRNKLSVRSRTEVATWALEHGLMPTSRKERGTTAAPPSTQRRKPI